MGLKLWTSHSAAVFLSSHVVKPHEGALDELQISQTLANASIKDVPPSIHTSVFSLSCPTLIGPWKSVPYSPTEHEFLNCQGVQVGSPLGYDHGHGWPALAVTVLEGRGGG